MIALDAVQTALRSPQPWSALDELVRAELSAGRLTNQIHDEFAATLDEVRSAPDHDEDREEPLLDTLDRLNGFCRADIAYRNPPVLPTEDEIAKLPRWARVAFAARCGRRLRAPLQAAIGFPEHLKKLADTCLALASQSASLAHTSTGIFVDIASHQDEIRGLLDPPDTATFESHALVAAVSSYDSLPPMDSIYYAVKTARIVQMAVPKFATDIRRDFDLLPRLALAYGWTDDTPVPPEVLGPLWPEGKPAGWPDDPEMPKRTDIALEAVSSGRVTDTMIEDEVVNLFLAMNRFHIARTGHPLTVGDFHPFLAALAPAGV